MVGYPRGVRPDKTGKKVEIRWRFRGRDYSETLDLRPTKTGLAQAAGIRNERINALTYRPSIVADANIAFADVAQQYLDTAELAKSTRDSYRDALNIYWMPTIGHLAIRTIRYATLRRNYAAVEWKSAKTRTNVVTALRQVFRFALECDLIDHNPATKFRLQRRQRPDPDPDPDPYSVSERNALLSELSGGYAGFYFRIAFGTGMRTGELLALTWADWDGSSFGVHKSKVRREIKDSTKTYNSRRVMVGDDLAQLINERKADVGHVIVNQYGRAYQSGYHTNREFRAAHERSGVRTRSGPYPWRHTYTSLGLTAGLPPPFLAKQLGHSLEMFYRVYARWISSANDLEMARRIEKSWGEIGEVSADDP